MARLPTEDLGPLIRLESRVVVTVYDTGRENLGVLLLYATLLPEIESERGESEVGVHVGWPDTVGGR
jgi:hypothetical protein